MEKTHFKVGNRTLFMSKGATLSGYIIAQKKGIGEVASLEHVLAKMPPSTAEQVLGPL